jgi:hypothetical protein
MLNGVPSENKEKEENLITYFPFVAATIRLPKEKT